MRGQRGAGHIEFIISFLLFIVVVGLFLTFINPTGDEGVFRTSLKSVSETILENVSSQIEIYGVKINENNKVVAIDLGLNGLDSDKVLVKNLTGSLIGSQKIDSVVYASVGSEEFIFIKVGIKEDPELVVSEFPDVDESFYQIGSVYDEKIILEENLKKIVQDYFSDYDGLKKTLKIPEGLDFSLFIDFGEGEIIAAKKETPLGLNVYSDTFRKEVVRINGEEVFVDFRVSIW